MAYATATAERGDGGGSPWIDRACAPNMKVYIQVFFLSIIFCYYFICTNLLLYRVYGGLSDLDLSIKIEFCVWKRPQRARRFLLFCVQLWAGFFGQIDRGTPSGNTSITAASLFCGCCGDGAPIQRQAGCVSPARAHRVFCRPPV